jgi:hypothetical protein
VICNLEREKIIVVVVVLFVVVDVVVVPLPKLTGSERGCVCIVFILERLFLSFCLSWFLCLLSDF